MEISNILINWYSQNKRCLPWRETNDPYKIWVSEIILQQTRVDQGLQYFIRFVDRFPDVSSLANAGEDEVLKLWQGLGYYTRARNMHTTAKIIKDEYFGIFPVKPEELLKLKGIGPYTAAAIASICFAEPVPVVDGNVMRVISRLFGITTPVNSADGKKAIHEICNEIIDKKRPGDFNQAIMEFGALLCTPQVPDCARCPLQPECEAFHRKLVDSLPVKLKQAVPRTRHFNYLAVIHKDMDGDEAIYIRKRTGKDIWKGLYELPLIELPAAAEADELYNSTGWNTIFGGKPLEIIERSDNFKHQLSHQTIQARFFLVRASEIQEQGNSWQQVKLAALGNYPIPRLIEKYLNQKKILKKR
jgi:A/G-specific adenine glycosylase